MTGAVAGGSLFFVEATLRNEAAGEQRTEVNSESVRKAGGEGVFQFGALVVTALGKGGDLKMTGQRRPGWERGRQRRFPERFQNGTVHTGNGARCEIFAHKADIRHCVAEALKHVTRSEEHTSELQSLRHLVCR